MLGEFLTSTASLTWKNPRLAGRIPELDGVRGLAILLVLVYHYFNNTVQGLAAGSWQAYLFTTLHLSWSGVDLFFVLSGFLIGGILYDAKDSRSYYRTFYGRRFYRILPLYFIWLALFIAGLYFTGPNRTGPLRELFNRELPLWSYPVFLQNFGMAWRSTFGPLWIGVTWSLAIEEQFYLLLPMLVRNLSTRGLVWLAAAAIVGAPVLRLVLSLFGADLYALYTLLPCRADSLGLGVLVALACRNRTAWEWMGAHRRHLAWAFPVLGFGVALLIKYPRFVYTFGLTWIAAFYASLLLLILINPGPAEKGFFRSRIMVYLGTVAYAVYICHLGINALFHIAIFGRLPVVDGWLPLAVTMLSLVSVMLVSALSWRFLERPLIRHAHAAYRY
jgi:peptidoglycan/LPS O-acetylase OafA/YrhL